jgi:4-alpha-glucanotransferase
VHDDLYERAQRLGIQLTYRDAEGNEQRIDDDVLPALIDALSANENESGPNIYESTDAIPRAFQPVFATLGERCWLLAVQLYSLQTEANWGHGDFGDLAKLLEAVARAGGDGVGLNPLHALFEDRPDEPSPYAPSSRRFLNPLYLDMAAVPGLTDEIRKTHKPAAPCDGDLIDYPAVAEAKYFTLRLAHRRIRAQPSPDLTGAFNGYKSEAGSELRHFAVFTILRRRHGADWRDWPMALRNADATAINLIAEEEAEEIDFQEFLQWQAHEQLSRCKALARRLGLRIGLYMDLAVGVHPHGFDAWNDRAAFLKDISIGAPPDMLNKAGQSWGLTAFSPTELRREDYRPFRDMLSATMRYAGAIRFDHILGLNRLYLIPSGRAATSGAYVTLPLADLLAVIATESHRHECLVIGEDLGTVPEGFRETLRDAGIWTFLVMLFSRDEPGAFLPPESYAASGLALFGTHDLPTLAGWLKGRDLAVLRKLGIPAAETPDQREENIEILNAALENAGIPPGDIFTRITRYLARTPSGILSISIEDVFGIPEQVNLPGTDKEYPNWRRCLPLSFGELAAKLIDLGRHLAEDGRGNEVAPAR